jgi:hypothetical protein
LYEVGKKYAWLIFVVQAALILIGGLIEIFVPLLQLNMPDIGYFGCSLTCLTGRSWTQFSASDPGVASYIVVLYGILGASIICFSLLVIAIASTSYRRGEKWAWYALWVVPLWNVFENIVYSGLPPLPIGIGIALVGLFLPYRRFFPKSKSD